MVTVNFTNSVKYTVYWHVDTHPNRSVDGLLKDSIIAIWDILVPFPVVTAFEYSVCTLSSEQTSVIRTPWTLKYSWLRALPKLSKLDDLDGG